MENATHTPKMRASMVKENLRLLLLLGTETERQIREDLSKELVETIENAGRFDWLPIEVDIELNEIIWKHLGDEGTYKYYHDSVFKTSEDPLMKPIISGAINLFGLTPHSIIRFYPRLWTRMYKDCGQLSIKKEGPTIAHIIVSEIPRQIIESRGYIVGLEGAFSTSFTLCRVKGKVFTKQRSTEKCMLVFVAKWEKKGRQ